MGKYIKVTVEYDEREVKKAVSFFILSIRKIGAFFCIFYPILAIAVVICMIHEAYAALSIVFIIFGYLFFYLYYIRPIDGYIRFYQKKKCAEYKFTNTAISVIGTEIQSMIAWSIYKKAYETPSAFLLLDDNKFIYIFPKKCFKGDNDIDLFRSLLHESVRDFKGL